MQGCIDAIAQAGSTGDGCRGGEYGDCLRNATTGATYGISDGSCASRCSVDNTCYRACISNRW